MTGLDPEKDTIMSLACFITDYDLNLLDENGYEAIITHSQQQMDAMGDWCKQHHGQSGLTAACLDPTQSKSAEQASLELIKYIQRLIPDRRKALLAGNTVHADKGFLVKQPYAKVINHLHHRILDVSAIKEDHILSGSPQKAGKHEARADILESIAEAKYYREKFFVKGS